VFKKPRLLQLRVHPDPILTQRSAELTAEELPALRDLIANMGRTMYENEGCGLAAVQVGVTKRLLVYDVSEDQDDLRALINPRITFFSDDHEATDEGCLSFPGLYEPVERSLKIRVEALDLTGEKLDFEAQDFLARVLQHEIDHLDGVTMLERMDEELRSSALREYFGLAQDGSSAGDAAKQ